MTHFSLAAAALLAFLAPALATSQPQQPERPSLLLADTLHPPLVTVSWATRGGGTTTLTGSRPYKSQGDKTLLGGNIEAYIALGGTRLDRGRGHPKSAFVRCGLYKLDSSKPFFEGIADDATITVAMSGIRMNQPAEPLVPSGLMHLKYMTSDLAACGIDSTGRNLFVTVDPEDPIKVTVVDGSGRFGWLDGAEGHGSAKGEVQADGSITITFSFPYALLRHTKDPEQRTTPGSFFEPQHFHIEMELMPAGHKP